MTTDYLDLLAKHPRHTLLELDRLTRVPRHVLITALDDLKVQGLATRSTLTDRWELTDDGRRIHAAKVPVDLPPEPDPDAIAPPAPRVFYIQKIQDWMKTRTKPATVSDIRRGIGGGSPTNTKNAALTLARRGILHAEGEGRGLVFEWIGHGEPG